MSGNDQWLLQIWNIDKLQRKISDCLMMVWINTPVKTGMAAPTAALALRNKLNHEWAIKTLNVQHFLPSPKEFPSPVIFLLFFRAKRIQTRLETSVQSSSSVAAGSTSALL